MRVDLFDFDLPPERIALRPAVPRDAARLLRVDGQGTLSDHAVVDLASHLKPGDCLVFNDTRVIPAQLEAVRLRDGGPPAAVGLTLHRRLSGDAWRAFARGARKLKPGDRLEIGEASARLHATVAATLPAGEVELHFAVAGPQLDEAIKAHGRMPLPPYIATRRATDEADRHDYQTVYSGPEGAVAAPTAGLHFTPALLASIEARGVTCAFVTLHVGAGTFQPVKADDTAAHVMHEEWGEIGPSAADAIAATRARGGRVVCVGTTSLRLLEAAAQAVGPGRPWAGTTDIFITPGYRFLACDRLLTNFHLPRSTLFMLVSAFSGLETMQRAYAHAIAAGYRFYSYGDACLLDRSEPAA